MVRPSLQLSAVGRSPSLYEVVSAQLVAAIREAGLAPGTRIPSERDLGEQFGVSRTVIREAVRHLAAKGVLQAQTGSGIVVADIGHQNVAESLELFLTSRGPIDPAKLQEVRLGLELQTAALAARRSSEEQLAAIRTACDRLLEVSDDLEQAASADVAFHRAIAEATGNPLFGVLLDSLGDLLLEVRRATLGVPGRVAATHAHHDRIARALEERDPEGAVEAMRAHLDEGYQALSEALVTTSD